MARLGKSRLKKPICSSNVLAPISNQGVTRREYIVPFRRFLVVFTLFALVVLAAPALLASDTFRPVSPEELKMTSEPKAPGAPAIILYRQVDRDDSGESGYEVKYIR